MRLLTRSDRGAAAVEFALILIPLLLLVFGILEFGRLYFVQLSLTNAARDSSRVLAITGDEGSAATAAESAPGINVAESSFDYDNGCDDDPVTTATVTITRSESVLGFLSGSDDPIIPITLEGRAVTVCGG